MKIWGEIVLLCALFVGCSWSGAPETPYATSTPESIRVEGGQPLWATNAAKDFATMRRNYPKVFVARVKDVRVESVSIAGRPVDPAHEPTVAGKPAAQHGPTQKISFYSIAVTKGLSPEAPAEGSEVTFAVSGTQELGSDGIYLRFVMSGDDLLSVGGEYLLFTTEEPSLAGVLVAAPWGKFEIDVNGLSPLVPEWSRLPFVQQLENLDPEGVAQRIALVDAGVLAD